MQYVALDQHNAQCAHLYPYGTHMTRLPLLLALTLLPSALASPVAQAQVKDDLNVCLCRNVLARTLCKQPEAFNFIDEFRDSATYSFTVFYANKETRFLCMVTDNEIRIKGRAWQTIRRTIPLEMNTETSCGLADYSTPDCPQDKPIVCCGQKTKQDISEDKAYEFWSRPIPELLEEELRQDLKPAAPE